MDVLKTEVSTAQYSLKTHHEYVATMMWQYALKNSSSGRTYRCSIIYLKLSVCYRDNLAYLGVSESYALEFGNIGDQTGRFRQRSGLEFVCHDDDISLMVQYYQNPLSGPRCGNRGKKKRIFHDFHRTRTYQYKTGTKTVHWSSSLVLCPYLTFRNWRWWLFWLNQRTFVREYQRTGECLIRELRPKIQADTTEHLSVSHRYHICRKNPN